MSRSVITAAVAASLVLSLPVHAVPYDPSVLDMRSIDRSGGDLAKQVSELVKQGNARRAAHASFAGAAAPVPGWTATQVGDTVFLQEDGSHGCDQDLSYEWFAACLDGEGGAMDAFYGAFPDWDPQYVSFYLAWDINAFFAFYSPIANDVDGIGEPKHGNPNGLNGLIFMNSVDLYRSYGEDGREFMFDMIWGQEFGHRWGSFVTFIDEDGEKSNDLLGRDDSHWSYFLDTDWSWMEGNDWVDNGDGTFTTEFSTFGDPGYGYSQLDLYLMGLIPPSGVADFFYIDDPSGNKDPEDPPAITYGNPVTIEGRKVRVGIDQVIEAEGERDPSFRESPRHFRVANIVILRSTDSVTEALSADMTDYTEWTSTHFSRDTFGLGFVDTGMVPEANEKPVVDLVLPTDVEAKEDGDAVTLDASGTTDPDDDKLSFVWDFGDGTADYTTGPVVDHVFRSHGDLTVSVTVVDERGEYASQSASITVEKADSKGGDGGGVLGIGCSVGSTSGAVPPVSAMLLAVAGALGLVLRRRRTA